MLTADPRSTGTVTVTPSVAVEVAWRLCRDGPVPQDPPFADFWQDDYTNGDEVVLLAHQLGLLASTDFEELARALGSRLVVSESILRLASEKDRARVILRARVERLARSPKLRTRYVAMLRDAWAAYQPTWDHGGQRQVERSAERYRARLRSGTPWTDLAPNPKVDQLLPGLLPLVGTAIPVTLVPTVQFGQMFVLDLGDTLMVAVPSRPEAPGELGTEHLTRRLKALAHPTRLAMIRDLATTASSVTELTETFGLAQPTVTNHVKLLRDAGLLTTDEQAGLRALRLDDAAARSVIEELSDLLGVAR